MATGNFDERLIRIGKDFFTITEYKKAVFGEDIINYHGKFARKIEPKRSKLGAALINGLDRFPLNDDSNILYLGASTGTTVSYLSDVCIFGRIYAVEVSIESFYRLLGLAEKRRNIYPIIEDANMPEKYSFFVDKVDLIYQDIAQRNQIQIFNLNAEMFPTAKYAFLVVKTRSISSRFPEQALLKTALKEVKSFNVRKIIDLAPFDQSNFMVYMER